MGVCCWTEGEPHRNPIVITVTFPIPTVANRSSTIAVCPEKSSKLVGRRCFGAESNIYAISHAASPHPQEMGGDPAEALRQRPRTARRHLPSGDAALRLHAHAPHAHVSGLRPHDVHAAAGL